ncbi:hypothetical protein B9T25_07285 [Acinetobacter sp. ANC 4470]|nr:hypothetical protein B9T25_07285 [Acinetobacter sp. ANC 4470]
MSGCGGESGQANSTQGATSSKPEINLPVKPPLQNADEFVRLADIASELTASSFSLEAWNPKAIQLSGDILYIADSTSPTKILRYDVKNKKNLTALTAENAFGNTATTWADISDIYISSNRLYVSASANHRVDVFDISTENPNFIMSLGTGSLNGGQPFYAMTNPSSVTANDKYVFVADQLNRINMWTQDAVTAKETRKFNRLSLPGCAANCAPRLEVVGDQLYASTTNGHTYVYDIKSITETMDTNSLIQPIKTQNSIATVVHSAQDNLLYTAQPSGKISSFSKDNLLSVSTAIPSNTVDSVQQYRVKGQTTSQTLPKSLDLTVYGDTIYTLSNQKIIALPLRKIKQVVSNDPVKSIGLLESQATEQTRMLQDGESWATLTNTTQRNVLINKILSVSFDGSALRLQSYSAAPVTNLKIEGKLRQSNQWVEVANLDRLTPFSNSAIKLKIDGNTRFNLINGKGSVQLPGLSSFDEIPADLFDEVKITSDTDVHVQKLNTIKAGWKIVFGTYDEPGKWCRITPAYAREWVIMMTNLAYMLSTPEFETLWFNHKAVMGHDFFGNSGKVEGAGGFYKAEDYKRVYQEILNRGQISLGVTNMGGGLGGGQVLGVDGWLYYGHYRLSGYRIIAHEFGHHWGGHNSAWAMEGYGFEAMIDGLNFYFQRQPGSLPYMDPTLNNFHLTPSSELCQSVSSNILSGVASKAPWNKVDEYFKNNPLQK